MSEEPGHYAAKQLFGKSQLINWSHRGRFMTGVSIADAMIGPESQILDYGCGDGTFIEFIFDRMGLEAGPRLAVGAELSEDLVTDCESRRGGNEQIRYVLIEALKESSWKETFDVLFCMEVFEHVVDRGKILSELERLVKPGGHLVISVPVEIGPSLLVKQTMRTVAGWRGVGDYPGIAPYTWGELMKGLFADELQHIKRPVHGEDSLTPFHCHKGFNWRTFRSELEERFLLEKQLFSPVGLFGSLLASQVWFVLKKRP